MKGPEESARGTSVDTLVVGAGAAGLWAAARLAELGRDVCLLEKTQRTGTKILASGGTRCNLTTTLGPREARDLFGKEASRFLKSAFRTLTPEGVRERFHELGVPTEEAPLEKIFPRSGRARDVRDALERWARAEGVRIEFGAAVRSVRAGAAGFIVDCEDGRRFECGTLHLCPGGKSYSRSGTTGDGYGWLSDLGLELVPPVPALVPLSSPASWVHELSGIAVQEVEARLYGPDGKLLGKRARPVLFTHAGLSGPGSMDLSEPVARARAAGEARPFTMRLDLVPDLEREALRDLFVRAAGDRGAPRLIRVLGRELPRRLLARVCAQAGIEGPNPSLNGLARAARHGLVEAFKGLEVPIDDTLGFDQAEVTAGGLALHEVDPGTMRVKRHPGLHVFGELLDLTGPIGGLNFQAAFATAELSALALR